MTTQVLIVDDDGPTRLSLRVLLEGAGYAVVEAPDGASALRTLEESAYGMVVLLDNLMPEMDGSEVLEALADRRAWNSRFDRAHTERESGLADQLERHAFILMTASPQRAPAALVGRLTSLGATIITKPFDLDAVVAAVARGRARLERRGST